MIPALAEGERAEDRLAEGERAEDRLAEGEQTKGSSSQVGLLKAAHERRGELQKRNRIENVGYVDHK